MQLPRIDRAESSGEHGPFELAVADGESAR